MFRRSVLGFGFVLILLGSSPGQKVRFRQDNTALPPFGGYVPGTGAVLKSPAQGPVTFRQGSFASALPAFGGYVPGSGARLDFDTTRAAMLRQQMAGIGNTAPRAAVQPVPAAQPVAAQPATAASDRRATARSLRRERAAEQLLRKGQQAEAAGNMALAKKYYQAGLKREADGVNDALRQRLLQLTGQPE